MRNRFSLSEWSGAFGDLGITLPLAYALIVSNGYPPERLFFLWGLIYISTGLYYGVPVAVQPLKAMAVIAVTSGFTVSQLSTAAFFFAVLLLLLSLSGALSWLEKWFGPGIIRGVQLGIGLLLMKKAVTLVMEHGFYIDRLIGPNGLNPVVMLVAIILIGYFQLKYKIPVSLIFIVLSVILSTAFGIFPGARWPRGTVLELSLPDVDFFIPALVYLIVPQLPLTLGNAIYAACDSCRTFWPSRSVRINPKNFGITIGLSNALIGVAGGFPICHGAGGIAAHAQFGGKTGGTTVILGTIFVLLSLTASLSRFIFLIPVPVLGALLFFTSLNLILMTRRLEGKYAIAVAVVVGLISFVTRNISIALVCGLLMDYGRKGIQKYRQKDDRYQ
jgi:SulP family sulfate permease